MHDSRFHKQPKMVPSRTIMHDFSQELFSKQILIAIQMLYQFSSFHTVSKEMLQKLREE
jgi:hypothetical protein